jgi:mono/diheme cytochrome c family protein
MKLTFGETMFRVFVVIATFLTVTPFYFIKSSQAQTSITEKNAASVHAGEEVFTQNCHQCHAVFEGQYSVGPNLHLEMKRPHPKKSAAEIREILKNGKGKMPSFEEKLSEEDVEALLAYIRTL